MTPQQEICLNKRNFKFLCLQKFYDYQMPFLKKTGKIQVEEVLKWFGNQL